MELTGRVTADAVVSTTKSRKEVVEFSIAINDYYKQKGATEALVEKLLPIKRSKIIS